MNDNLENKKMTKLEEILLERMIKKYEEIELKLNKELEKAKKKGINSNIILNKYRKNKEYLECDIMNLCSIHTEYNKQPKYEPNKRFIKYDLITLKVEKKRKKIENRINTLSEQFDKEISKSNTEKIIKKYEEKVSKLLKNIKRNDMKRMKEFEKIWDSLDKEDNKIGEKYDK